MRVLMLINSLNLIGRAEKVATRLACLLQQKYDYTLHVAYLWDEPATQRQAYIYLPLATALEKAGVEHTWLGIKPNSGLLGMWQVHRNLSRLIQTFDPNIIHSHCLHPDIHNALHQLLNIRQKKRIRIRTLHSEVYLQRLGAAEYWFEKYMQTVFKSTVVLCESVRKLKSKRFTDSHIQEIPNPIASVFFKAVPKREPPKPPFHIGIVGRLANKIKQQLGRLANKHKQQLVAFDALGLLHKQGVPATLSLAGKGHDEAMLKTWASQHPALSIEFVGGLSETALANWYDKLDLLAIPSAYEGFHLGCAEAMARGLPVVGTDVCGVRDMLQAIDGIIVPIGNAAALAAGISQVLHDNKLYNRLQHAGKTQAQNYQEEAIVQAHHALYSAL